MEYHLKGNLSASLCLDFTEKVTGARVFAYLIEDDIYTNARSSERKKTVRLLDEKEIRDKATRLIGMGKTDSNGNYEILLSENYTEKAIALDVEITHLLDQKRDDNKPVQFTVRELRPFWRQVGETMVYSYNYCFSFDFWTKIRSFFDIWTIFGYVRESESEGNAIEGVIVYAYDTDWIKDDELGDAITDAEGRFRIDYTSADFKNTFLSPLVNIETPISTNLGPGVYFKVKTPEGVTIYDEGRAMGRSEERKHVPKCCRFDIYLENQQPKNEN